MDCLALLAGEDLIGKSVAVESRMGEELGEKTEAVGQLVRAIRKVVAGDAVETESQDVHLALLAGPRRHHRAVEGLHPSRQRRPVRIIRRTLHQENGKNRPGCGPFVESSAGGEVDAKRLETRIGQPEHRHAGHFRAFESREGLVHRRSIPEAMANASSQVVSLARIS